MSSFEAFAKGVDYGLSQRLACALGELSRQPIGVRVFDTEGYEAPRLIVSPGISLPVVFQGVPEVFGEPCHRSQPLDGPQIRHPGA